VVLVDSSVWIDYLRGATTRETQTLDSLLSEDTVAVGDLIVMEVLQGVRGDKTFDRVREELETFALIEICGYHIALQAAKNHRALKARGISVRKTIDTLIATRCIEDGIPLLHSDRDFEPFVEHLGLKSVL
jgi:predicted nucleic acid-binding protein